MRSSNYVGCAAADVNYASQKKLDVPQGMAPPKAGEGTAVSVPVTPLSVGPDDPFRPERVGWTPHFKFPDKGPHDVQESLLDSDTALDGVLADKFYGGM